MARKGEMKMRSANETARTEIVKPHAERYKKAMEDKHSEDRTSKLSEALIQGRPGLVVT